ncbi:ATP-binding protein [Paracoccus sp. JM45]|uniref:AAA family ATPase n=1 Tax=Paracoccus sp. JM45 TaxID=2283626 RepID=UPI000E6C51B9|nr:ATP-binding protein [Paracoccus sp. JM45]RJE79204.1 chromosome segregation protein SMC [Paracoccus sp. JM45]
MKIRAIELTNIRRFAGQTARIDGIVDGITVLSEPNEFGKSTFFDAMHALFFERHRGTKSAVKALQPHSGGAPEVAMEIDLPQGRFRIEKRWLSRATARILQNGRLVAQDDEAEAWIDNIIGNGLAGPSGLLWVRQGLLGMEPEGSAASDKNERERTLNARRDLLSSVAGEIDMMTGGRRLDAVAAQVGDALTKLATATGRPKAGGEWGRAEAEADALRAQETDLATKAARLSGDLARRAEVQRELRDLENPDADRQRNDALTQAQAAQAQAAAHAEKLADAQRTLKLAAMTEENTRASIDRLQNLSERVARAETELAAARETAMRHDARAQELTAADTAAGAALTQAQDRTRDARDRLAAAQRAQMAQAARGRADQLAGSLARAETLRTTLEANRAQRGLLVVTPKTLAAAEQARDTHDQLAAQLAAASVSVSFRYDGALRVQDGGADLPEGPHRLTAARNFDLPGIGTMRVDPGAVTNGDEGGLAQAATALAAKLAACGADTLPEARQKLTEAQRLDEVICSADDLLAEIAPDGLDALRHAHAKAVDAAGTDNTAPEDATTLETELTSATQAEDLCRDAATQAHAAFLSAAEARAGARSTLVSAERTAEAARAEAGDLAALERRIQSLRDDRMGQQDLRAKAQADYQRLQDAAPDLDMAAAHLARMQSVVAQAQTSRAALREELATLNGSIGTMAEQGIEEQLDDVRGRLATSEARAARYASEVQSLTRLRGALEDARRDAREAYFDPVMRELEPLISVLHPGAALQIDDQSLLPVALTRNGQAEPLEILSGGTREQVAVLTRLAFARLFARTGTAVPVILDDALVHSDDDRIEAMFTALHRVAADQQILVLTCRQRAFATLGGYKARVMIEAC